MALPLAQTAHGSSNIHSLGRCMLAVSLPFALTQSFAFGGHSLLCMFHCSVTWLLSESASGASRPVSVVAMDAPVLNYKGSFCCLHQVAMESTDFERLTVLPESSIKCYLRCCPIQDLCVCMCEESGKWSVVSSANTYIWCLTICPGMSLVDKAL